MSRGGGYMSLGVYVLGGIICPWGKCPGGTCPWGFSPVTMHVTVNALRIL